MRLIDLVVLGGMLAPEGFVPAYLRTGSPPTNPPPNVVGGGQVALELTVDAGGIVTGVDTLGGSAPFSDLMHATVTAWRFEPASESDRTLESRVLVAAIFRAPVLSPGPAWEPPTRGRDASCTEIPFPAEIVEPPYPAMALGDGVVLLEVNVGREGQVIDWQVLATTEPFTQVALAAARGWRFEPACRRGRTVPAVCYLAFGFRAPITPPRP